MGWKREDASHYRYRAEELRTKADMFSPDNCEMLMKMAELYETFANEVETGRWEHAAPT
jgi:hypothetical protein